MSNLEEYLRPSLYISELKSKRKSSVLEELVGRLASEHLTRHPNLVLDAVRRR
jgi:hypothetical protein